MQSDTQLRVIKDLQFCLGFGFEILDALWMESEKMMIDMGEWSLTFSISDVSIF